MPSWAEREPSEAETELLRLIYITYLTQRVWPQLPFLEAELEQRGVDDIEELVQGVPLGLLWPDPAQAGGIHPQQAMAITAYGLTFVPDARRDLMIFLGTLVWGVRRRRAFTPPPQGPDGLSVSIGELVS